MELTDPIVKEVLLYMLNSAGPVDLMEFIGPERYDEVVAFLYANGLIEPSLGTDPQTETELDLSMSQDTRERN